MADAPRGIVDNDPWNVAAMTDRDKEAVIACLLSAEGNTRLSNVSGATDPRVSQIVEQTTVEVSALYMVSYVITGNFDHANAVAIRDPAASDDDEDAVRAVDLRAKHKAVMRRAYAAYRSWYADLRKTGWRMMVALRPDPLVEAGLRWY
ncbi:MAG: hypothetical protein JNM58_09100 [Xanthomonadaceae bacterium]|nr:hypothetical protein [Xanthomonadaceae bacterium]